MTARAELNAYLEQLEKRLKRGALLQGMAIVGVSALVVTLLLVPIANRFAFSDGSLLGGRLLLVLVLGLGVAFGLAIPVYRLTRRYAAKTAETANPAFNQSLITFAEREGTDQSGFLELLASDTLKNARITDAETLVPNAKLMAALGAGFASFGVLLWLIIAGPGFMGYGAALLWMGGRANVAAMYELRVTPGDATVRRNSDELITAQPVGVQANKVQIFARYLSASKWEELAMQPQPAGSGYQFVFAGIPDGVEYYVQAGPLRSRHFNLKVVDVAGVKQIKVTYRYPAWTGMPTTTDEHGGDVRAIAGTQADLEIHTDRPLPNGLIVLDDRQVNLSGGANNTYHATIGVDKDGSYHVGTVDQGQPVRLSEDYFIEADKANPPDVALVRPNRDYQASPIEEVTVQAKANDDFGLQDFTLHYSVNGAPEKTVDMLKAKGAKAADGSTLLSMENFKAVPGDVVSVYATAKDAKMESRTDMFFIQAEPFEREFSQSQESGGGGGGGGGGGADGQISAREKEIIGSTWKQLNDKNPSADKSAENAKFLSDVQSKLRAQAQSLTGRLASRDIPSANEEFGSFEQDMKAAADAMAPATDKLQKQQWKDALPNEQKALQYLLRAEATFRQIEVAFGRQGGGGGGGSAGRDLASLFDLELDTEKNQYETAQHADSADQRAQDIDAALKKLDELARREEELAQNRNNSQTPQERWQQEMLRREAEQLQEKLKQMAQNSQGSSQGGSAKSGQNSQSAGGGQNSNSQNDSNGSQQQSDGRAQQALNQLKQANDDMRRASEQPDGADARRAAERLRQAQNLLNGMQQANNAGALDSLANEASRLSSDEKSQGDRIKSLQQTAQRFQQSSSRPSEAEITKAQQELGSLVRDRQKQADDLAKLQNGLRAAEQKAATGDRATATKLRDALSKLDESDAATRIQRSADRLQSGYVPNDDSTEQQIESGMQQLSDAVRQAQQSAANNPQQNSETALNRVENLRDRLESLDRNFSRNGQNGQGGQDRQGQAGQNGNPSNANGQPGQNAQGGGQMGRPQGPGGNTPGGERGYQVGPRGGDAGGNYGSVDPGAWIDTGGQNYNNHVNTPEPSGAGYPNLGDTEQTIQQGISELSQLRDDLANDPEARDQVDALLKEMQNLDPKRFPGNPAMVEELHQKVLNDVDKLELQLRSKSDPAQAGQVRSTDPMPVPSGYSDAVAEYFRRLAKNQN
jgi:hypothetical protein